MLQMAHSLRAFGDGGRNRFAGLVHERLRRRGGGIGRSSPALRIRRRLCRRGGERGNGKRVLRGALVGGLWGIVGGSGVIDGEGGGQRGGGQTGGTG